MANSYFQFKKFRIEQAKAGMKVTTDACYMGSAIPLFGQRILDIGAGTGLLTLMTAQRTQDSLIDAIEIDQDAYLQAQENIGHSSWADRINIHHTSLQNFKPDQPYDQIICNPPFFKANQKGQSAQKNKALHNDLLPFDELAKHAAELLSEKGSFWVMYPATEMTEFILEAQKAGLHQHSRLILRNKAHGPIFRTIVEFSLAEKDERQTSDSYIKEADGSYSDHFIAQLKAFYLHL